MQGSLVVQSTASMTPALGNADSASGLTYEHDFTQTLQNGICGPLGFQLTTTSPVAVPFSGLPGGQATFARVYVDAGVVQVQITHADGTNQVIPIDSSGKFEWGCLSVPLTAINLIGDGVSGNQNVTVILGS